MWENPPPNQSSFPPSPRKDNERRYLARWEIKNRVLYRKPKEDFFRECQSRDLHSDGVCIDCVDPLLNGATLSLAISLSSDVAVNVEGKICWKQSIDGKQLVGIKFENINKKVQDMILDCAFNLKKEALTKNWFEGWK